LTGRRRIVKHLTEMITDHAILVIPAESTGRGRVIECLFCYPPMQLKDKISRERLFPDFSDTLHGLIVV
jgi:hypothetical protein